MSGVLNYGMPFKKCVGDHVQFIHANIKVLFCILATRHRNILYFLYVYDTTEHPLMKLNTCHFLPYGRGNMIQKEALKQLLLKLFTHQYTHI